MAQKFQTVPELVAVAQAYKNPDHTLIADKISPRVPVKRRSFQWQKLADKHKAFRLPDTAVSPTGRVNQIEFRGTPETGSTVDNAIDVPLSAEDLAERGDGIDVQRAATELAMSTVKLRHEYDVASAYFNPDNYETKETLTGAEQLNSGSYTGNPIKLIRDMMAAALMKPNVLAFGEEAWAVYSMLPAVVSAILGNSGDKGIASPEAVARLFGVQEVLIGESVLCTSKPGEDPVMARIWGPHIAGVYRDRAASPLGGVTFGFTAQYGGAIAGLLEDKDVGMLGGARVRAGESTKTVIVAPAAGFMIEDAVAVP